MVGTRPIGYVQVQRSWIGVDAEFVLMTHRLDAEREALSEHPNYFMVDWHVEKVFDGAGVAHNNLYVGFAPRTTPNAVGAEPLNPHNLNDAPMNNIGDPARDNALGAKEQRF